jgi:hypothetical protein
VIQAGPASTGPGIQNGNCDFVAGPFTDLNGVVDGALINGNGSFNVGSVVTVAETVPTGFNNPIISSPTSPLSIRTFAATISILNTINEIVFVNSGTTKVIDIFGPPNSRKKRRFF